MAAIILRVKDTQTGQAIDNTTVEEFVAIQQTVMKPVYPKFKIGANIGYGWRGAKLSSDLPGEKRDFYKKMMSGMVWDGSFHYYFNDIYGVGLLYSSYYANNSIYAQLEATGETGMLYSKDIITFIGPAFVMRTATND
ncbi:hypothetical protein AGMMS50262_20530 [Bacteroidia bacterium]|nr:hypothetical protein AGMMS50262_20530 [Bacteroidia bacterium]